MGSGTSGSVGAEVVSRMGPARSEPDGAIESPQLGIFTPGTLFMAITKTVASKSKNQRELVVHHESMSAWPFLFTVVSHSRTVDCSYSACSGGSVESSALTYARVVPSVSTSPACTRTGV